jgi:hypothetical protein
LFDKTNALVNKTNVFVKPNEQCRACSNIVMARIGNRQHGALGEVERQNALFEERKKNAPIPPKEETPMRLLRLSFSPPAPSIRGARLSQTNELPHCGVFVFYD